MAFYLLLEDGGKLILEDSSGFLLLETQDETIVGDSEPYEPTYIKFQRQEAARIKAKQDEIIARRLEAQQATLLQRELKASQDKQTTRQLEALEAQLLELQNQLLFDLAELGRLERQAANRRNHMALLILAMACPFISIRVH